MAPLYVGPRSDDQRRISVYAATCLCVSLSVVRESERERRTDGSSGYIRRAKE